jgi:signal transduction histidine kinase
VWYAHIPRQAEVLVSLVNRLFFVPLFMSSLLFGLKGGLVCAALISLNLAPAVFLDSPPEFKSIFSALLEIALYFFTGAFTGFLVDRERLEARRQKEDEDLAMLGQAAAAVAHELKTPLVAIGGFANQIQRDLGPEHGHRRKLGIIVEQTAHMEKLLREMLDYSRPLELRLRPCSLRALAEEVISLYKPLAQKANVRLSLDTADGGVRPVVDGPRLKQVILNLVQNAVQASPPGSEVLVRTECNDHEALVKVSDQGRGIPRDQRDKVFSPFFTTKTGGTGLGLPVSHKIVSAHGGSLELAETRGSGSTFVVHIPLGRSERRRRR